MLNRILTTVRRLPAFAVIALAAGAAVGSLNASVIVAWDAKSANTTLSSATASTNDANLSGPVTLTLGPGFTPNSVGNTFGGYYTGDTSSGLASANSHGTYFEFTLTPASGYQVQITDLVVPTSYNPGQQYGLFIWQGSAACAINLASSSDSYGSSLGTVSPTGLGADSGYWTLHLNSPLIISSAVTFRIEFSENFGYKTIGLQADRSYWDPALLHNALEIDGSVTATGGGSQPATTTTTLGSSPNPSTVGQSVTFTATVQTNSPTGTATAATGNVVFKDGGTTVYTGSIANGVATYTTSGLSVGTHTFTAVYSGDSNFATSTSAATNQTVNGAVSSGPAPITYSGLEGLTVGGINGQNDNPTQWFAAWSVQNGNNSYYTVQNTTPLTFGSLVTSSDGNYLNGGGNFLSMGRRLPTGSQSIWDANGSVSDPYTAGEIDRGTVWVSFLMRVNSSITSWDNAKIALHGNATPYDFSGGGLQIATISGNSSWGIRVGDSGAASTLGSVSVGTTVFVVIKLELSTTAGQNNAYVWMFGNPSAANLGGADLNTGTAMASLTGKNTTDLRFKCIALYLDNAADRISMDEFRFGTSYASVSPVPATTTTTTTTTLGSSPNPSTYGQPVTFTATVQTNGQTATDATGNVVFKDGGTPVSTNSAPVNGVFTYTTSGLTANTHAFTAVYSGDSKYATSTSTATNQVVNKATPTVTVTPYSVTYDGNPQSATVASITGVGSETGVTVGSVTLNTTHTAAGSYPSDSWTFTGTANYNNIGSTTISNNIGKASSSVTVNGTTSFTYNGSAQGPAFTVSGSGASLTYAYSGTGSTSYSGTTAPTAAGTYSVTASVAQDDNYNSASSSATAFTIARASSSVTVNGTTSFTYNGSAQGPAFNKSGSSASLTYAYSGTGSTSYSDTTAPTAAGTYSVIASVAADANFNGASSSATAFTIVNPPPTVTGTKTVTRHPNQVLHISKANDILSQVTVGTLGDTLSLTSWSVSTKGVTLTSNPDYLNYAASSPNEADSFSYTVTDNHGNSVTGTINITIKDTSLTGTPIAGVLSTHNGSSAYTVKYVGVIGAWYRVQRADDAQFTQNVTTIHDDQMISPPVSVTDNSPPGGTAFYRVVLLP